ncbi:MAG: FkbM family methyltransferase [Erythrobacter sp.]
MEPVKDPLWQAAADHLTGLGLGEDTVSGPAGFEAFLPGCRTIHTPPPAAAPAALVLHKGRLEEVDEGMLRQALDTHVASFANEVFIVLSRTGTPLDSANPHAMSREALLAAWHEARRRNTVGGLRLASQRMPATYVGQGRVLLETAFGHLMLVDGEDTGIVPHLIRDGWFDRNLTAVIAGLLAPGMTFIDVGANFGTYTIVAAERVGPRGQVIAIEAAPAVAALLVESVSMNGFDGRSRVVCCAAGAEAGTRVLHQFATRKGGTTLLSHVAKKAREAYGETIVTVDVACRTLDDILAENRPERVDLIKLDIEGSEYDVLQGARETLWAYRPRLIIEWNNGIFEDRPEDAERLYKLITCELGYSLRRIKPDATTRPIGRDELMTGFHDLVAAPSE